MIDQAMQVVLEKYSQADPCEKTEECRGHVFGYKPKTVNMRVGRVIFSVREVRECGFYPFALEKRFRSERALTSSLAEMYVQGVSTRKVKAITEQLCGFEMFSSQISRATEQSAAYLARRDGLV